MNIKPNSPTEVRDLDQVFNNFKSSLMLDPNFVPALIGLVALKNRKSHTNFILTSHSLPQAGMHFRRKNYRLSLEFYQKILMIQPDIDPDVRIPIGICFLKLDMDEEATLAFSRALELVI